jgi:hypothetical protein
MPAVKKATTKARAKAPTKTKATTKPTTKSTTKPTTKAKPKPAAAQATKKPPAAAAAKRPAKKAAAAAAPRKIGPRADLGAPVDGFFAKQPAQLSPILDELRAMIGEAALGVSSAIKWGMAFYDIDDTMMCALAGFKSHVNLILPGPPGTYPDPDGLLEGEAKTGRHLKVRSLDELPREAVRGWLATAAARARAGG